MMIPLVLRQRMPIRQDSDKDRRKFRADARHRLLRSIDGYTLLELVIVLAIIGVLAAISMPALMRPWSRSQVQQAAQELTRDLLTARMSAMREGKPYQFRWRERTGEYEIVAWQDLRQPTPGPFERQSLPRATGTAHSPTDPATHSIGSQPDSRIIADPKMQTRGPVANARGRIIGRLANDVVFAPQESSSMTPADRSPIRPMNDQPAPSTGRESILPSRDVQQQPMAGPWSEPIWFFPEGRSSSAELTLRDADGYTIRVSLRGMTGTITVGVVKKIEVPNADPNAVPSVEAMANDEPVEAQRDK